MASTALTSDIQAALEHAVGQANNAFSQPIAQPKKKKKRSRPTEDDDESGRQAEVEIDGQFELPNGSETKKRKRKKINTVENDEGQGTAGAQGTEDSEPKKKKKKTKKQDKGKQPDIHQPEIIPVYTPQNPFDLQVASPSNPPASTAAFLSALVTAASETQPQPEYDQQQPQYLGYPPMGYPYHPNPQFGDSSASSSQQPSLFPVPMGVPINDLAFSSNEDIVRALQDLDMAKIANVLKTLGEAAAAANMQQQQQPGFLGGPSVTQGLQTPTPLNQVPTTAGDIMSPSAMEAKQQHQGKPGHNRVLDMSLPGPEQHMNVDHAYLLANKWMNAGKLSDMVREHGLVYKKGKFSAIEEQQLKDAIEHYRVHKGLTPEQLNELIFAKNDRGARDNAFWSEITSAVPQRPIIAVYHHVRRSYHPMKQQGKWMDTEDVALIQAVADLGQAWEKVSLRVGRMSSDCRDRYRNHIANRDIRITGAWKKEEEDELIRIVTEMTVHQGKDIDNDVFWGKVSERMGNTRGRQQCRIKWTDSLSKTVKNEGQKPRWSQQDAYILVHKVDSLNVRDDTEIDWKTLPDPGWNLWSAHSLQRRWLTLKRSIKGFEEMTHQEIMDILRVKKAQLPAPPIASPKKRKITITSAVTIADDCDASPAGSSTGPGTFTRTTKGGHGRQNQDTEQSPNTSEVGV